MPDWAKRIIRTLCQTTTAGVVVALVVAFGGLRGEGQAAAVVALLTVVFSAAQNGLEEAELIKPILK